MAPMPPTDTFPLADRLVPGGLAAFLASARAAGDSFETIAYKLRAEHDIPVSSETIRKWCARPDAASAPTEGVAS